MTKNNQSFRPPVVTVMGHVDHGKTTLLDTIRTANIAAKEAGAITQHLGAYQVEVSSKNGPRLITFIDTPGHAAFTAMRKRGASITDLVILVISAGEGIMPQTKECIRIIQENNLTPIVAITKIDLPNIFLDKIKGQLVESGLTPEEYGGQIPVVALSSKTKEGIDKLLETILIHADVMELTNQDSEPVLGLVVESSMDTRRGPVATVIMQKGVLHKGDFVYAQSASGKIKNLLSFKGVPLEKANASTPVEILGFTTVPSVGSPLTLSPPSEEVKTVTESQKVTDSTDIKLPVILKADTQGTLEALKNSFPEEVQVISSSVGSITDTDVFLAQTTKATIYAFNLKTAAAIQTLAHNSQVNIVESKIIYEIIESISQKVLKLMEPTIDETILGEAQIIAEFKINKVRIAGVKVTKGEIKKGDSIHLKRESKIIKDTKVGNIQQAKNIVEVVKSGQDCGMTFLPYVDFKTDDILLAYKK